MVASIAKGYGIHQFVCDKYKCEVTEGKRNKNGLLIVTGIAATCDQVNGEIFTPEVLERDAHTMIGKPITNDHSNLPFQISIKDIIGYVTDVWYERDREAMLFRGEIFDDHAISILEKGVVITFSAAYYWDWWTREEDNIRISKEIKFTSLGLIHDPADIRAQAEEIQKIVFDEDNNQTIEYTDTFDYSTLRSRIKYDYILKQGYECALRNKKWGNKSPNEIMMERAKLMDSMLENGEVIQIRDDVDKKTLEYLRNLRFAKVEDILSQIHTISEPIEESDNSRIVKKIKDSWCVVHAHPKKPGSETDKAPGTPIKCYAISEFGEEEAKKKAQAMHYAIMLSEQGDNRESNERNSNNKRKTGDIMGDEQDPKKVLEEEEVPDESVENPNPAEQEPESHQEDGSHEESEEESEEESTESDDDEDGNESADESEEPASEKPAEEERQAKQDLVSLKSNLEAAIRSYEGPDDDPIVKGMRETLKTVEGKMTPPESDEVRALKKEIEEKNKKLQEFETSERTRKISERVEGLLKDKLFLPAERESVADIVSTMDDKTFTNFRKLVKSKPAYNTEEKGQANRGSENSQNEESHDLDPYKQKVT